MRQKKRKRGIGRRSRSSVGGGLQAELFTSITLSIQTVSFSKVGGEEREMKNTQNKRREQGGGGGRRRRR